MATAPDLQRLLTRVGQLLDGHALTPDAATLSTILELDGLPDAGAVQHTGSSAVQVAGAWIEEGVGVVVAWTGREQAQAVVAWSPAALNWVRLGNLDVLDEVAADLAARALFAAIQHALGSSEERGWG